MVGAAVLASCGLAQHPPPAPPRHTDLALAMSSTTLANGLHVVLVQDPRASQIQVTMQYRVGLADDPPGQEGMAHLAEHLMFQQVLGSESLFAHLEHDATDFNAETELDETTFHARALPGRLDELLTIQGVRLGLRCTSITDSAFERERQVVIEEHKLRGTAREIHNALLAGLYPDGHPYHRANPSEASLGSITREQACAFIDAHYTPGNAALVISGPISEKEVATALTRFIAHVAARPAAPAPVVPAAGPRGGLVHVPAAVDERVLVVAWPLPLDPGLRTEVRMLEPVLEASVDGYVHGLVAPLELGGRRAPMFALVIQPAKDETIDDAARRVEEGVNAAGGQWTIPEFDAVQQSAIHALYEQLEDGSDRDRRLANDALRGLDAQKALAARIRGLNDMTVADAIGLTKDRWTFDHATLMVLEPSDGKKLGKALPLAAAIHDLGQRREQLDPGEAERPAHADIPARPALMRERTLPNGLHVVLLPITSVPTVDVSLVFHAGMADEPADRRGAALLAAKGLSWNLENIEDALLFVETGGQLEATVGRDATSFSVQGLDMHLDLLLSGLRRYVRDGYYKVNGKLVIWLLRRYAKHVDDDGPLTDAWRTALFGTGHPYVAAGLVRRISPTLAVADAERFRAAYYQPDDATLVIAGRFDADLADRWIDYLFADWQGHAHARVNAPAAPAPASLAEDEDTALITLGVAIPAKAGTRAQRLVAAEMLEEIVEDVRHQLGASYDLAAELSENRLATSYRVSGSFDATRAVDAMTLVRDRVSALHTDAAAATQAFLSARRRVLAHLGSITGSASLLAELVSTDLALGRRPFADLETASQVAQLTIDAMSPALADLDLGRAVVLMRGPHDPVQQAFGVLGRTPQVITKPLDAEVPGVLAASTPDDDPPPAAFGEDLFPHEYARALSEQGPPSTLALTISGGYVSGGLTDRGDATGFGASFDLCARTDPTTSVGLHVSIASSSGVQVASPMNLPYSVIPIDVAGAVQGTAYDRLWGTLYLGIHLDRLTQSGSTTTPASIGAGLEGGIDLLKLGLHRFGVYARVAGTLGGDLGYSEAVAGLAYRL